MIGSVGEHRRMILSGVHRALRSYLYKMLSENKEIYFHVGLGKTASKFLQHKIFPKLKGIGYVKPTRYKYFKEVIDDSRESKILITREFDNQLEEETEKFAAHFPNANTIIILRRHDSWLASQYRRHVKNGHSRTFEEFIDVENDHGIWRRDKVFFMPKLKHLEKLFGRKPLVLFHEELAKDPRAFIEKIANYTGTSCDWSDVSMKPHHTSYSDKQLRVMRKTGKYFFSQDEVAYSDNPVFSWLQRRSRLLGCYIILYAALLVPDFFMPKIRKLIPDEALDKVRRHYASDWEQCLQYVRGYS